MKRERLSLLQLLPNMVTILGMCAGISAIRFGFDARFELAAALIVFAAILDGLDGLLARRLGVASNFGAELDSFSDFVSFGVAPGILVYLYALSAPLAGLGWVFVLIFSVCASLRLARYNINRDGPDSQKTRHFVGVPAPAGAMLALLPVFVGLSGLFEPARLALGVALYLAAVGLLMVSRLPTPSMKAVRIAPENAIWVLIGMGAVVGLLFLRSWAVLVVADLAYLAMLGWLGLRHLSGRRRG